MAGGPRQPATGWMDGWLMGAPPPGGRGHCGAGGSRGREIFCPARARPVARRRRRRTPNTRTRTHAH
eukprot:scaffold108_cov302-Prasinococcus_capsulatus_cf.AAC.1